MTERQEHSNAVDAPPAGGEITKERKDREARYKLDRLAEFLDRRQLDGVLLLHRANFAWITNGRENHAADANPMLRAAILATADSRICLADSTEAPRMKQEVLAGVGIGVVSFPWYDPKASAIKLLEVIAGRRIAGDTDPFGLGLRPLPEDFATLRWALLPEEIARYREGASRASAAMEQACNELQFGATENEAAGVVNYHLRARGCWPLVTLVAADDRITKFGYAIPTDKRIDSQVMLAVRAEYCGLVCSLTRMVSFGPVSPDLAARQQALAHIDARVNLATRPGRSVGQVFRALQEAYADNGYPDQWKLLHQGGSAGYATRETPGTPLSPVIVRENQAFAWSPAVPGSVMEDTMLCTGDGVEVLTAPSKAWPKVVGRSENAELARADVLAR
jgi:Xaa-Pro dipeptidase